jgi:hypothetical protein
VGSGADGCAGASSLEGALVIFIGGGSLHPIHKLSVKRTSPRLLVSSVAMLWNTPPRGSVFRTAIMRSTSSCASVLAMLLLGACDQGGDDNRAAPASSTVAAPPALANAEPKPPLEQSLQAPSPEIIDWLRGASVTDASFERGVLYSWTTKETAARLRKAGELFDDNQLPEGPTAYVRWLEHIASRKDAGGQLARALLGHPDLRRRRYAWHRPFATRLGLGSRDYGDQLIRVELDPRAIIGRFNPEAREVWSFRDLDGRPVPLARALAEPGRIGAILHIREGKGDEPRYREYVLCNEAMIAAWSLATPAIASAINADIQKLNALAAASPLTGDLERIFSEVLAFYVPRYRPTRENLEAAARALSTSIQEGPPLNVRPTRRFDASAAPALVQVRKVPPRIFTPVA